MLDCYREIYVGEIAVGKMSQRKWQKSENARTRDIDSIRENNKQIRRDVKSEREKLAKYSYERILVWW